MSRSLRGVESGDGEPGNSETEDPRSGLANQNERLPLWEKLIRTAAGGIGDNTQWAEFKDGATCTQDFYTGHSDGFVLIDWREMELILAEVAINASDNATGLVHINNVRTFHGLDPYTEAQMLAYDNPKGRCKLKRYWSKSPIDGHHKLYRCTGFTYRRKRQNLVDERNAYS